MISPTAEYALRAVVYIARAGGEAVVTPAVAEATKVPSGYLPKVLQTLRRAGIVDSKRGLGGGFTLSRPADEITVLDVINAVDPLQRIERCPLGIKTHTSLCPLHQRLDDAIELIHRTLGSTTIAELLSGPPENAPLCQASEPVMLGTDGNNRRDD